MATKVNKYRVWCTTDNKYVEVWGEVEPSVCPENNAHSIDTAKTVITDAVTQEFPMSIDTNKLAVQSSAKPVFADKDTYAVWVGAGDDPITGNTGGGDLLNFDMIPGNASTVKEVHFHPDNGAVWINEAYIRYDGAGSGDFATSAIMAPATPLQQAVDLNLYIENNWVKYAVGSPNPATHGFAGTPILVPRNFSKDGDWDWDGTSLTPNFAGTGGFKISDIDQPVHRFVNRIPCRGTTQTYFNLASDDTAQLLYPYFIRVEFHNTSDTTWNAQVFLEIYRERTIKP